MRRSALCLALLGFLAGCSTPSGPDLSQFDPPNSLLRAEIQDRIEKIPYQRDTELVVNLVQIAKLKEMAIPQLIRGLASSDPFVRVNVAWTLGQIRDRRTVPFLRPYLRDPHNDVRLETGIALVNIGDTQGIPILIGGLESENMEHRYHCHKTLARWSGMDFGYNHQEDDPQVRQASTQRWWAWWKKQENRRTGPNGMEKPNLATPSR